MAYVSIYSSRVTQTEHPVQQYLPKNKQVIAEAVFWQGFRRKKTAAYRAYVRIFITRVTQTKHDYCNHLTTKKERLAPIPISQNPGVV